MGLFHTHEWMELNEEHRSCSACCRIERRVAGEWTKIEGVTQGNWHIVVRRIILDGCDSLAEHRKMLGVD